MPPWETIWALDLWLGGKVKDTRKPWKRHSSKKRVRKLRDRDPTLPSSQIISSSCRTALVCCPRPLPKMAWALLLKIKGRTGPSIAACVGSCTGLQDWASPPPSLNPTSSQHPVPQTSLCFCKSCLRLHNLTTSLLRNILPTRTTKENTSIICFYALCFHRIPQISLTSKAAVWKTLGQRVCFVCLLECEVIFSFSCG